jgi:hypothetical protein
MPFEINSLIEIINSWFKRKTDIRDRHLNKIQNIVLKPWLRFEKTKISLYTLIYNDELPMQSKIEFDNINKPLFDDMVNHFPKLINLKKSLERKEKKFQIMINSLEHKLKRKYKLTQIYSKSIVIFLADTNYYPLKIIDENLVLTSYGFYAASGNKNELENIKIELEKIYRSKTGNEFRKVSNDIIKTRQKLIKEIERALATEHLQGECEYV